MPTADSSQPLFAKCLPRYVNDVERTANVTTASIVQVTPDDFATRYLDNGQYVVDHSIVEADFIGKSTQPRQNGFYDLIRAYDRMEKPSRMGSRTTRAGILEFEPFIKMGRKDPINDKYWQVVFVAKNTVDGKVEYTLDATSATGIPSHAGYFPAGLRVHTSGVNKANGTKTFAQLKVKSASVVSNKVRIVAWAHQAGSVAPAGSRGIIGDTDQANVGVLLKGTPNVSDYEKYCAVQPPLNSYRESMFWVETTRKAFIESDLTRQYIDNVLADNPYYKKYVHVDEVEYNRQIQESWEANQVHQFFFGKASDANQTATDWPNLPTIALDSEGFNLDWNGKIVGRKADTVGVLEQLWECDRVTDLQGEPLILADFFDRLYEIKRVRRDLGQGDTNIIEVITTSQYALEFQTGMIRYFDRRSEGLMRLNMNLQQSASGVQGPFGFTYTDYRLDYPQGMTLRVMTHEAFDDWHDAHRAPYVDGASANQNLVTSSSMMWLIDWSNIYRAILASNSVTNRTGTLDELAALNQNMACRMKVPQTSYRMDSVTMAVFAEVARSSWIGLNFDACVPPDHTTRTCGKAFMPGFDPNP